MFNSNLWHNILNALIIISGAVTAFLLMFGCVELPTGFDCSSSVLSPTWAAVATTVMGLIKTTINLFRDGIGGLVKVQPPVE